MGKIHAKYKKKNYKEKKTGINCDNANNLLEISS